MSRAFISHSSKQKELAEFLVNRMGRDNCILDKYNFESGGPTLDQIISGIQKTELFVLLLSDDALNSEWVKTEINIAKNLKDKSIQKQLLILNIDAGISHTDLRIPEWLTEEYNLEPILDPIIIYKKINSKLRDIAILEHPFIAEKEEIFLGRNDLMKEFERKYFTLEMTKPSVVVASGLEGVGRRKFLLNALDTKAKRVNKFHNPIIITLDARDSIEDFIIRVEDLNSKNTDEVLSSVKNISLAEKIQYAKNLLLKFQKHNEILFILDKGGIIQPNKSLAKWFEEVINAKEFADSTIVCLISSFRPHAGLFNYSAKFISFYVNELSPEDRQTLFIRYCQLFQIYPPKENTEKILYVLNGMPAQIFFTAFMIKENGSEFVVKNLEEIKKYEEFKVFNTIKAFEGHHLSYNILLFISKFEFVSFDLVYRIFGRNNTVDESLESLFIYGVYDRIGVDKEYIKVHHAIMDYILRAKLELPLEIRKKLRGEIDEIILQKLSFPDASEMLVTIRSIIQSGGKLPEKYFIPSIALRTIVDHYYEKKYNQVHELALRILSNYRKYDEGIVREIRYWLALSYAKNRKEDFFEHLKYFEGVDHYFLLGFYRRFERKYPEAEKYFYKALEYDQDSQKARRELVSALLRQNKYSEALEWARKNYEKKKLNAFHIQAYFICLLRKPTWSMTDKKIILELMENIKKSHDFKADEIFEVMRGEYEYYIMGNMDKAVELLTKAKEKAKFKNYPTRALAEIYRRRGMTDMEKQVSKLVREDEDDDESAQ